MRHLIFIISLFALVVWNLSCTKETIETQKKEDCTEKTIVIDVQEGSKFAGAYKFWFHTSNSTDNALTGEPRRHEIFDQADIQYQKFFPLDEDPISYLGVFYHQYIMEILFDNDSIGVHKVSVGYTNGEAFTHYPDITDNLLRAGHPARMISYTIIGKTIKYTNGKRDQLINLRGVELAYDNVHVEIQYNTPMTKSSNSADYGHRQ